MVSYRVRLGRNGVLYLPSDIRRKLRIEEGGELLLVVREDHVELKPVKSVFTLGVEAEKIAETSVEEFEAESEEAQRSLYG